MKKILIPTDFSSCAFAASQVGIVLAKKAKAELHFLHILNTPVEWSRLPKDQEKNYPEVIKRIAKAKSELLQLEKLAQKSSLKVKSTLVFDKTSDEILVHLNANHHDFVVMGSHGTKGIKEMLIGSNAQRVVRFSPAPVLIVKRKPAKFAVKQIVFASDFGKGIQKPFDRMLEIANLMNAHVHAVYVNVPAYFEEMESSISRMKGFLKKATNKACSPHVWNAFTEERGILNFSEKVNADIIALGTHWKEGVLKRLSPSIAEALANHSEIPVLITKM